MQCPVITEILEVVGGKPVALGLLRLQGGDAVFVHRIGQGVYLLDLLGVGLVLPEGPVVPKLAYLLEQLYRRGYDGQDDRRLLHRRDGIRSGLRHFVQPVDGGEGEQGDISHQGDDLPGLPSDGAAQFPDGTRQLPDDVRRFLFGFLHPGG